MPSATDQITPIDQEQTCQMLRELNIAVHRHGYTQLTVAIPYYAHDRTQGLCKELYPFIAAHLGYSNWHAVERSIRDVILVAWEHRDPDTWEKYFPDTRKAPTNKVFIATLADRLR